MEGELYASAQRFAQRAMEDLTNDRSDDFFLNAGTALEHLLKTLLVHHHPLLLVGATRGSLDIEGMAWALGDPKVPFPSDGVTVSCTEALRRVRRLVPSLAAVDLRRLIEARNGVAHVGRSDRELAEAGLSGLYSAVALISPHLGRDPDTLWGNFAVTARVRATAAHDKLQVAVADRLGAAMERFELRLKREGNEWLRLIGESMASLERSDTQRLSTCPACGSSAISYGTTQREQDAIVDVDEDGVYSSSGYIEWDVFSITSLRCFVCGLHLNDKELAVLGVETVIEDDVVESEYPDWEPDEDMLRDR